MSSNGYFDPTDTDNPYNKAAELNIGETDQVGVTKLGAVNTLPGSVAGYALRHKVVAFDLNTNSQIAIAHGCTDENGNAATPLFCVVQSVNGDGYYFSQAPDATDIYMTAPAGATTAVSGNVVVFY